MPTHRLPNLTPGKYGYHLAAYGLAKCLATQADPDAKFHFVDGHGDLIVDTKVVDLEEWLVYEYSPSPIFSPWNGGSGYYPGDKTQRQHLEKIRATTCDRLAPYRDVDVIAQKVVAQADEKGWDKATLVRAFRNQAPAETRQWLDTVVPLTTAEDGGISFGRIGISGGNDGRLEFSAAFRTYLMAVLPELGAKESTSRDYAMFMAYPHNGPLVVGPAGLFEKIDIDTKSALVNPWQVILAMEGMCLFASSAAHRLALTGDRASFPFQSFGADGDRSDIWVPRISSPVTFRDIKRLFDRPYVTYLSASGKETPQTSAQYHAAMWTVETGRVASPSQPVGYTRYSIAPRFGLSHTAKKMNDVDPCHNPIASQVFAGLDHAVGTLKVGGKQLNAYAQQPTVAHMVDVLDCFADVLIRQAPHTRKPLDIDADAAVKAATAEITTTPEWRLGIAFASCAYFHDFEQTWTMPLDSALRSPDPFTRHYLRMWATSYRMRATDKIHAGIVAPIAMARICHIDDLHALTEGLLDEREINRIAKAFSVLDWANYETPDALDITHTVSAYSATYGMCERYARREVYPGHQAWLDGERTGLLASWLEGFLRTDDDTLRALERVSGARAQHLVAGPHSDAPPERLGPFTPWIQPGEGQRLALALLLARSVHTPQR